MKKHIVMASVLVALSVPVIAWADVTQSSQSPQTNFRYSDNFGYSFTASTVDNYLVVEITTPKHGLIGENTYLTNWDDGVQVSQGSTANWESFKPFTYISASRPVYERVPIANGKASIDVNEVEGKNPSNNAPYYWETISYSSVHGFSMHDNF